MKRTLALPLLFGAIGCGGASGDSEPSRGDASIDSGALDAGPDTRVSETSSTDTAEAAPIDAGSDDDGFAAARSNCDFVAGQLPSATFGASIAKAKIPLDTIVIMMLENRSFDHYFSQLPAYGQPDVDVAPATASNPDDDGTPIARFHQSKYCFADTNHEWDGSHEEYDDGANDGFVKANNPNGARAMGYFDQTDIPWYYGVASTFGVADHYHCALLGPTWPNRMYMYAASSFGVITNTVPAPGKTLIFDRLNDAGVTWRVYRSGTVAEASIFPDFDFKWETNHVVPFTQFVTDAANGNLPQVVFVDPAFSGGNNDRNDEHPPNDMQYGEAYVQETYNALASGPQWAHAAMFVTYDENGGLYDHVAPGHACPPDDTPPNLGSGDAPGGFDRYGFRVPLLVMSPYSKPHYVSHVPFDHTSLLRFLELRFNMPALSGRDANANVPLDFFDFSSPPRFLEPPDLPGVSIDPAKYADSCQ